MPSRYFRAISIYIIGVVLWLVLVSVLRLNCIVDIPLFIDSLWTKPSGEHLVVGLTGAIGFRVELDECETKLIYTARYYPDGMTGNYLTKNLTDIMDIDTLEEIASDNTSTTYADSSFKYVVYRTSDGASMRIFDK